MKNQNKKTGRYKEWNPS